MRAGYSQRLQRLVERTDMGAALIAEVRAVAERVVKETASEWAAMDSTVGLQVLDYGGVRLSAGGTTSASHATGTDDSTALGTGTPWDAVAIDWTSQTAADLEFRTLTARLHPQLNGGNPKTVATWRARIYRVLHIGAGESGWEIQQVRAVEVEAAGTSASDVSFDLTDEFGRGVIVGPPPSYDEEATPQSYPITVIRITAIQADGTDADNVSWQSDIAEGTQKTGTGYIATHRQGDIAVNGTETGGGVATGVVDISGTVSSMPRFALTSGTYSAATATFSGAANDLEISVAAQTLRVVAQGEEPSDSTLTWQLNDGVTGWVTVYDGDIIGADNTDQGGADLSTMSTTGPWSARVTLTPSTGGLRTPVAQRFGIENFTVTDLRGVCEIADAQWQVDPVTLKANIPKATVRILKTGEKDYRDYGSDLLASYDLGDIEVAIYVGDPTDTHLDRSEWMLHSVFELEDYYNTGNAHELICLSPLRRLRKRIPPFVVTSGNNGQRVAVELLNQTRKAAYEELVDTLAALPGRFRGPGIEDVDTDYNVSKTIRGADCKDEMDAVAFLGGDAIIDSQGRVKAVPFRRPDLGGAVPVATFPRGTYTPLSVGPGYTQRLDEYFIPVGWDDDVDQFAAERRYLNASLTANLGGPGIEVTQELDEEVAKWIPDGNDTMPDAIGKSITNHFAAGLVLWDIQPIYPHPHIECGDVVVVDTDLYVARNPITGAEVRGPISAIGVVAQVRGFWGEGLRVWVPASSLYEVANVGADVTVTGLGLTTKRAPTLEVTTETESTTTGTFGVTVHDPDSVGGSLYYRTKSGTAAYGSWTLKTATPADNTEYTQTVTLVEGHPSHVQFRLDFTLGGDVLEITETSAALDRGSIPNFDLQIIADDEWNVSCQLLGDFDFASAKIAQANGASPTTPTDATVRARSAVNVSTGRNILAADVDTAYGDFPVALAAGEKIIVAAFGYSGASAAGNESSTKVVKEFWREIPFPALEDVSLSVADNGTDDTYTIGWTPNAGVTDADHTLFFDCYLNGALAVTSAEASPATNTSKNVVDTGGGDGLADQHYVVVKLAKSTGGAIIANYQSAEETSTT